jgi:hypothetical protein
MKDEVIDELHFTFYSEKKQEQETQKKKKKVAAYITLSLHRGLLR